MHELPAEAVESILQSLEEKNAIDYLLNFTPLVDPGAIISNNFDWLNKFNDAKANFYKKNYGYSLYLFKELDKELPSHEIFLTPAKINGTFCELYLGNYEKYIEEYEPLLQRNKIFGFVLWNLIVSYFRLDRIDDAECCLSKWFESANQQYLGRGYLLMSLLKFRCNKLLEAKVFFDDAWKIDKDICTWILKENIGQEFTNELLAEYKEASYKDNIPIATKNEVLVALQSLLIPKAPQKYSQLEQHLSEFEYQGYVTALEEFSDGNINEALIIIDKILKGSEKVYPLYWAKAACLAAKGNWRASLDIIEDQPNDSSMPGMVFWNMTCSYFNLKLYKQALDISRKCTEKEYQTSALAWLAQGLLAYLCGESDLFNQAVERAKNISPTQLIYYLDVLRQTGFDKEKSIIKTNLQNNTDNNDAVINIDKILDNIREVFKQGRSLQAAEEFSRLAPNSLTDIPEIEQLVIEPIFFSGCPKSLNKEKDIFLSGVADYRTKNFDESLKKFQYLYDNNRGNYAIAINLSSILIKMERYTRSIEILNETTKMKKSYGGANAIRNIICAYLRFNKPIKALEYCNDLVEVSGTKYSDFMRVAYIYSLLNKKDDIATALFDACSTDMVTPSISIKGAAVKACLDAKDYDRAVVLVKHFLEEGQPLPYAIAGVTRPEKPAAECKHPVEMQMQYAKFTKRGDSKAALSYFERVYEARENDLKIQANYYTSSSFIYGSIFYIKSLIWNGENFKLDRILKDTAKHLEDSSNYYNQNDYKKYVSMIEICIECRHYFEALNLCKIGLSISRDNQKLLILRNKIAKRLSEIPKTSRDALRDLAELQLGKIERRDRLMDNLPKINRLINIISVDFPDTKKIIDQMGNLINDLIHLESIPIIKRKSELVRLKEAYNKMELEMNSYLPKTFISAFLPIVDGIRIALEEIEAKSITPEFNLSLEPQSYYRESEANLVYKLRNTGNTNIYNLSIKLDSEQQNKWVPILGEKFIDQVKKEEIIWIDWPIHLENTAIIEDIIRPKHILRYTGENLKGDIIKQVIDFYETRLMPFKDIVVDYPIVALRPIEGRTKLYGRENLIRSLKNSFTKSAQMKIPFLEGARKVGKTSIFYFLLNRFEHENLAIYINLTITWTNIYQLFASKIQEQINIDGIHDMVKLNHINNRDEFDRFLFRTMKDNNINNVILLLDEFHVIIDRIEKDMLNSDILGDLRDLYMNPRQKVSIALADWYLLDELKSRVEAQLWADFECERISFLNERDCHEAISSPAQGSSVRFGEAISRIFYWTNGYPWHTQLICSKLIEHLNNQKRYVVIQQDVDLTAKKLLNQDMYFDEGVCRRERLNINDQDLIYHLLDVLNNSNADISSWFRKDLINGNGAIKDSNLIIEKLVRLEILHERSNDLRFCSPLHAMWFESKRQKGANIYNIKLNNCDPYSGSIPIQQIDKVQKKDIKLNKQKNFDVFLCHNSRDKLAVKEIGLKLKAWNIKVWLDEWEIKPGSSWIRELEKEIENVESAAVFVGSDGIGPWQDEEIQTLLNEFVRRGSTIVPVLLNDVPEEPELPIFLKTKAWVDFRKGEPDPIKQLVWGITGNKR